MFFDANAPSGLELEAPTRKAMKRPVAYNLDPEMVSERAASHRIDQTARLEIQKAAEREEFQTRVIVSLMVGLAAAVMSGLGGFAGSTSLLIGIVGAALAASSVHISR